MNTVIFTQGLSPIVEPILEVYGLQAVVESGPRGSMATTGNTKLQAFCAERKIPYFWLTKSTRPGLIPFLASLPPASENRGMEKSRVEERGVENRCRCSEERDKRWRWTKDENLSTVHLHLPPAPLPSTSTPNFDSNLDLAAVYSMSQLLPAEVLSLFPRGVINAHPSKLPAYRGPNPYFWTFYDGCRETALTIHYLDPGEDTGDIILQEPIRLDELPRRGFSVDLHGAVKRLLAPCMLRALKQIEEGTAPRMPQPAVSPTARARNVTPDNVGEILSALRLPLDEAAVFFANTLGSLPLRQFGFRRMSGDWRVGRVVAAALEGKRLAVDKIHWTRHGFALPRPDGWVVLKPGCGCAKFVLKLLRDALRAIRTRKPTRPKIAYYALDPARCETHDADVAVREVTEENICDVAAWRGETTVRTFEGFLKQGRVGVYAYREGKVVGHAWLWRAGANHRRLFGWLTVPDGWDFVYYCRAKEDPDYGDCIRAMLKAFSSMKLKGEKFGMSVPENDKTLNSVIKGLSKSAESAVKEGTAD